jgi:membrane protein
MIVWIKSLIAMILERLRGLIDRMLAVRIVESSVVLAAQAFLALIPLLLVVYAFLPSRTAEATLNSVRHNFGVSGDTADTVQHLIDDREQLQSGISGISFLVIIGSATAFTRALQRVYQYAWDLPKLGLRGAWRTVIWFAGLICYLFVIGGVVHIIDNQGISTPLAAAGGFLLWWWTPFLLLGGRVTWRALLPGAVLTAIAQLIVTKLSAVIMPREIRSNEDKYGPIGVVFAVESWFIVLAGVLVAGAALGALMGQTDTAFGRWVRGTPVPDGWRRIRKHGPDKGT